MITAKPLQQNLIDAVRESMRYKRNILAVAPTGFGKSICMLLMSVASVGRNKRVWIVVPRRELIRQMANTLDEFNIYYSYIADKYMYNPYASIHLCSLESLVKRLPSLQAPDLCMIDETHYGEGSLDTLVGWLKAAKTWTLGWSASPWKLSGKGLGCWYDDMVLGPSIGHLIEEGYLSSYRLFAPDTPDMTGLRKVGGDWAKGQLASKMEDDKVLVGNAVKHYQEKASGKLNLAFCVSIKHSEITAQMFRDAGVAAMHIDGKTPESERKQIIRAFAKREIKVLSNVDLCTFGFDLSSNAGMDVCVEAMSDLRPTVSLALQLQKWGRVLRKKDEPALIFDHAGNTRHRNGETNHGRPCDEREWTLADREKKIGGTGDKIIPTRQCESCFFVHPPAPQCPLCKFVYPIQYRTVDEVEGELSEVEVMLERKEKRKEVGMAKSLEALIALGRQRGYKNPGFWAKQVMAGRQR